MIKRVILFLVTSLGIVSADGTLSGFVTDSLSGEALIGANVYIQDSQIGTVTDYNGYYFIGNLAKKEIVLVASYIGYTTVRKTITIVDEPVRLNIPMPRSLVEVQEVTVSAERVSRQNRIEPSRVNLSPQELRNLPSIIEPDIFRTIQSLPGVLTPSEFSTGLIIRGGNTDQNLILLDGITVYNPSHLGGVFSNFIIDAVKEADLIKGGFNAEYGGRLSAVLNILSREGNKNEFHGKTAISLLSAQTTLEGPSYKGAWILSGRRTYFDKVLKGTPYYIPYYFYDLQGHVFSDITTQDRISYSFYSGLDDFLFDDLGLNAKWGNMTNSLQYRKVFNDRLLGTFLAASSRFETNFGLGGETGLVQRNLIDDATFSGNFTFFRDNSMTLQFGGQFKQLHFHYEDRFNDSIQFKVDENPYEAASYGKLKWKYGARFIVEPGVRLNYFSTAKDDVYPDFRFRMKYFLDIDHHLNFAIGNYHQFIGTVQDDFNPTILDNWFAVDESVEPSSAYQAVIGYEGYFPNNIKFQFEIYGKKLFSTFTFNETRSSFDGQLTNEKLSDNFIAGDGFAYGYEVFLQRSRGVISGWLAYTYAVSRKEIEGEDYFTNWDRRHAFSAIGSWAINKKWSFNASMSWQSGQAYTPILGYYSEDLPGDPTDRFRTIPGVRNSGRYPDYHRLDLSLKRKIGFFGYPGEISLQVINAYNRKNIFRYIYSVGSSRNGLDDDGDWDPEKHDDNDNGFPDVGETNVDEQDEEFIKRNDISIFPIIPSIGFTVEF